MGKHQHYGSPAELRAIEELWKEDHLLRERRQLHFSRYAETIRSNRAHGMSREALEKIYGREAVVFAIGYSPTKEKMNGIDTRVDARSAQD